MPFVNLFYTKFFIIVTWLLCQVTISYSAISIDAVLPASSANHCDGGIHITSDGTAGPFTILITGPKYRYKLTKNGIIQLSNLCPGQYQVEVTYRFGCKWVLTPTVGVSCAVQLKELIEPVCNTATGNTAGRITITPTSGTTKVKPNVV